MNDTTPKSDDQQELSSDEVRTPEAVEPERIFLVVVDDSEEMQIALRFACRRAEHTGGRVALLYVIESTEFTHWMSVGDLIQEEAREQAEKVLDDLLENVQEMSGKMPVVYIREGDRRDELLKLIDEEEQISILVLAARAGSGGPGPLVSALTGKFVGKIHVPITLVPDNLTIEEIDMIS
ncbi:universal stress protein [Kiloniella sp. b19]|uniref:universal stress protein n=1 Tax=Kiloniella sp. GXU_MW_B19 TaxID=3141326 RepID=UPI0031DD2833